MDFRRFNSTGLNGYKTTPYLSYLIKKKTNDMSIFNLGLGANYSFENDDDDKINVKSFALDPNFPINLF